MAKSSLILGPMVGGLSHNSANVWARANGPSVLYVWLGKQADGKDARLAGRSELLERGGFAGVVPLKKLRSETHYFFAATLLGSRPKRGDFHRFMTLPKPGQARPFAFAFGSCYLPPDDNGGETMDVLRRRIESDGLRFGLMLGDQIYADDASGNGLGHIAVTLKDYRDAYEYAWSRKPFRDLQANLPFFMTLDDHEVEDDWFWRDPGRKWGGIPLHNKFLRWLKGLPPQQRHLSPGRIQAGLKTYIEHQVIHAPKLSFPPRMNAMGYPQLGQDDGHFAYMFEVGKAAFFVLDTRSVRVKGGERHMLGEKQWSQLEAWLLGVKEKYPIKFLVSSGTILHPFWLDITRDRWNGFPAERDRLFEFLATHEIEGMHILCGDLHTAHAVSAELKCPSGRRIPIHEFCATPFEQKSMIVSNTYHPLFFSKWLGRQKKIFHQPGQNFGIVKVDFGEDGTPHVTFNLHYNKNGWKTQPPVVTA